ncbi:MAG TPA: hypothetical protein VE127_06790 [Solirubrobacteraceae bacterium]|nr:hypothetical protein [Solirubrobacteraceae bacterium]
MANAGRIAGAAVGPLPLPLLEQLTGSYTPGLLLLLTLSIGSALAGWRWRTPDERTVGRSALRGLAAEA